MKLQRTIALFVFLFSVMLTPFGTNHVMALQNTPDLSGRWIGTLVSLDTNPLGAVAMGLNPDGNRRFSGDFIPGIPGLKLQTIEHINWTVAANGNVSGVVKASFVAQDGRVLQIQFVFTGTITEKGAILANGWMHISGPNPEQVFTQSDANKYFGGQVMGDATSFYSLFPLPPGCPPTCTKPTFDPLPVPPSEVINNDYFGGQDMGDFFIGKDVGASFGGQDMGDFFGGQDMGDFFGGQDMGFLVDTEVGTYFGGQDMGDFLIGASLVRRLYAMPDGYGSPTIELTKGGALPCVLMVVPVP